MKAKLLLTVCCMSFSLIASAQVSGGEVTRKRTETKPQKVHSPKKQDDSQKNQIMEQDISVPEPQEEEIRINDENENIPQKIESVTRIVNFEDIIDDIYKEVYIIKAKRVYFEREGKTHELNGLLSKIDVGVGFVTNGSFVTARSNIQPWIYRDVFHDKWCNLLAEYVAAGFRVIIEYEAYSTRNLNPIRFKNTDFDLNSLEAYDIKDVVTISKDVLKNIKNMGVDVLYNNKTKSNFVAARCSESSINAVSMKLQDMEGLLSDMTNAKELNQTDKVKIAGYTQSANYLYLKNGIKVISCQISDRLRYYYTLQNMTEGQNFNGSPVFARDRKGEYKVVGVNVGIIDNKARMIPLHLVR